MTPLLAFTVNTINTTAFRFSKFTSGSNQVPQAIPLSAAWFDLLNSWLVP
jgi:hypothetical protein